MQSSAMAAHVTNKLALSTQTGHPTAPIDSLEVVSGGGGGATTATGRRMNSIGFITRSYLRPTGS